jgi:tetratricopeptide (TPR) repeat protein
VPVSLVGHVQNEWWPRRFFVVFKAPPAGARHIFRKGEPYAQILFVPQRFGHEGERMTAEQEKRRRELEAAIDSVKSEISENVWHNPAGTAFSDHYKVLARAYGKDGQAGVDEVVRQALERRRKSIPADRSIAEALALGAQKVNERKYEEARAIFAHVLERQPQNPEALSQMGIVVACIGRPLVGLQMMQEAVALAPHVHTYQNNLGELLRLLGRLPEAEAAFGASLKLNPTDAGTMSVLGLTVAQQGRADEGLEHCRAAAAGDPGSAAVQYRLGLVLAQAGRPDEARAAYEAALAIDPHFLHARRAIEALPNLPAR